MSDQASAIPPPIPSTKTKRSWRWLRVTLAIAFVFFVGVKFLNSYGSVQLEVRRTGFFSAAQGNVIEVLNVGTKSITITDVNFNERPECRADGKLELKILKVGEAANFFSKCMIVRASIETSEGSATYSFSGN